MLPMHQIQNGGKPGIIKYIVWFFSNISRLITNDETGCIPSKVRVERKEKLRMKQVKFSARPSETQGTATADQRTSRLRLSSKFPFMKSKDNIMKEELSESSDSDFELADDWVLSYEPVHQVLKILHESCCMSVL